MFYKNVNQVLIKKNQHEKSCTKNQNAFIFKKKQVCHERFLYNFFIKVIITNF